MRANVAMFLAGVLFAVGLAVAGMTQPDKIMGFLDVFGAWDPSLLFVMGGAVVLNFFLFRWILRRPNPLFASTFHVPTLRHLDARLIGGAALFGAGWGLAGYCPGPGVASLATLSTESFLFVGAMLVGILGHAGLKRITAAS